MNNYTFVDGLLDYSITDSASTNGWTCPRCGIWIASGEWHFCYKHKPSNWVNVPPYISEYERIAKALERIADALEKGK